MFTELELKDLLSQAKTAITKRRCFFWTDSRTLIEEFIHLKIGDIEEIWPLVLELLQEISPKNYIAMPSLPTVAEGRVFRFAWQSRKMKKKMEIQFATKKETFYYISLRLKKMERAKF